MAFNWKGGTGGGLGGAATGAQAGSFFGPIGTAIGAGLGGIAGLLSGGLSGNVRKKNVNRPYGSGVQNQDVEGFQQSPNKFSPEQQAALNALLAQGQTNLANPTAGFEPIETAARSKFQRESIPSLAERFTALGGSDTRGSSDFAGMLGGAQSEFDQGLAALKAQYGQQGQQNALNMLQLGLTPQNEQTLGGQIVETGGNLLSQYLAGGGNFGLGQNKKAQEQGSITSKTIDQDKLKLLAQLVAMNKMKKGV
jgi:hypothetical protein